MRYTIEEEIAAVKKVRDAMVKERDKSIARPVKGSYQKMKPLIRSILIFNQLISELSITKTANDASKQT